MAPIPDARDGNHRSGNIAEETTTNSALDLAISLAWISTRRCPACIPLRTKVDSAKHIAAQTSDIANDTFAQSGFESSMWIVLILLAMRHNDGDDVQPTCTIQRPGRQ